MGFVFNVIASVGRQNDVYRPIIYKNPIGRLFFFQMFVCLFVLVGSLRPR